MQLILRDNWQLVVKIAARLRTAMPGGHLGGIALRVARQVPLLKFFVPKEPTTISDKKLIRFMVSHNAPILNQRFRPLRLD